MTANAEQQARDALEACWDAYKARKWAREETEYPFESGEEVKQAFDDLRDAESAARAAEAAFDKIIHENGLDEDAIKDSMLGGHAWWPDSGRCAKCGLERCKDELSYTFWWDGPPRSTWEHSPPPCPPDSIDGVSPP